MAHSRSRPRDNGRWPSIPSGWAMVSDESITTGNNNTGLACMPCLDDDPICKKWGRSAIARSHGYEGSGTQLQKILGKLRSGKEVQIGVIGGSISACAEVATTECYPSRLERELTRIFNPYGTTFKVINGAIYGTASAFFSTCWQVNLPVTIDLMIAEFSANDDKTHIINKDMDTLVRSVSSMENGPSMILLDVYSPQNLWYDASQGITTLGQFHDVPVVR